MRRRAVLLALLLTGAAGMTAAAAPREAEAAVDPVHRRLLAASDPFARAPAELRVELSISRGADGTSVPLEIWRRGENRSLVRFLAEKERGKFVLRRDDQVWLLTPGARDPVRLSAALAPAGGAALDQLLGLRLMRDYVAVDSREEAGVITLDLEAARPEVVPARVRWVVSRTSGLPLRAEFRTAEDRVQRLVEFKSWRDAAARVPGELTATEVGQVGAPLTVRIVAFEALPVPELLFDLTDPAARAARTALPRPD